jgi:bifunctional enzyme CysN/CysC
MSPAKSLLRFATTGSVDDGKSTLIGRLLFETGAIPEDQYEAAKKASLRRGQDDVDLSLLLDGLAAEREQFITIDVAYRHFSTAARKFIIADCPGHEQYTRNMISGASTADLAIILIDAEKGIVTQSRRHGFLVSLLGIPHLIVAVNKMDLVGYSRETFENIASEYSVFSQKMGIHDVVFIPLSALKGDNITSRSRNMPWYAGPTLLHSLEHVHVAGDRNLIDFRFPVQYVIRPNADFRGYSGRISSGSIRSGEQIVVLPSGRESTVRSVLSSEKQVDEATAGQSVTLILNDELDISRGDMIVRKNNLPLAGEEFDATLCWLHDGPMDPAGKYLLKHTTRQVSVRISKPAYRIDVNTLHRVPAETLFQNEIGRVRICAARPLFYDPYRSNRNTGSFILIDPLAGSTVAAGMIRGPVRTVKQVMGEAERASAVQRTFLPEGSGGLVSQEDREQRFGHKAAVVWLTGYSGAGKSTIGRILEKKLLDRKVHAALIDGDHVRQGLCADLGFSDEDRTENLRRAAEVSRLFFESGSIVISAFISPFARQREYARKLIPQGRFFEIYVRCDFDVCRERDPKGLYRKALAGEIHDFTGISSPYEPPENPELAADTRDVDAETVAALIMELLEKQGIIAKIPV